MDRTALQAVWRVAVFLFGLLLTGAGLYVLLHAAGAVEGLELSAGVNMQADSPNGFALFFDLYGQEGSARLLWGLGGLVAALVGILLIIFALTPAEGRDKQIVLSDHGEEAVYGGGRVTVTQNSVRDMVAYVAGRIEGVREVHTRLHLEDEGWHCECDVAVLPEASLPEVTNELRSSLQHALEHHTGLPVEQIDINTQLNAIDGRRRVVH